MSRTSASNTARWIVAIALVVAVAVLGVRLGRSLRDRPGATETASLVFEPPPALAPGATFPDVSLVDPSGAGRTTHDLLRGRGGVVLFLDLDCGSCSLVTRRWQERVVEERLQDVALVGIAPASPAAIRAYTTAKQITFPVYDDSARAFQQLYGLSSFPLQVVVGRSLTIQAAAFDGDERFDAARLRTDLTR